MATDDLEQAIVRKLARRLLPGEDPTGGSQRARHWIEVYSDLLRIKSAMLRNLECDLLSCGSASALELRDTTVTPMTAQIEHFEDRLRYWKAAA